MVAAELAAMFQDKQGGCIPMGRGEAYGKKWGFWLSGYNGSSTIRYPTVLTFGAVSITFIGMNDHDMTLASNKMYTLVVVLIIYWLAVYLFERSELGR